MSLSNPVVRLVAAGGNGGSGGVPRRVGVLAFWGVLGVLAGRLKSSSYYVFMRSLFQGRVLGVAYDSLPHWVVDYGCYAVTLRCRGSLPAPVRLRLSEITESLREIEPASPEAERWRRKQFAILEHSLDAGNGFAPFAEAEVAEAMHRMLIDYRECLSFDAWVIMPNHLHLMTAPMTNVSIEAFFEAWRSFKQVSAVMMNRVCERRGSFWQQHWYDRWVRNEVEYRRWLKYFAENPLKAGLCSRSEVYGCMRIP